MNNQGGASAFMGAVNVLVFMASLVAMVLGSPVLAEATRGPVAEIITSRYSYETARYLMTGYEWLVWPVVFLTVKAVLTLCVVWVSFIIIKRSFTP